MAHALFNDEVIQQLSKSLNYAAQRQVLIADNIANIETPLYRRKDISFSQIIRKKINDGIALSGRSQTHKNHFPLTESRGSSKFQTVFPKETTESPVRNNVSIDLEMSNMAINSTFYNAVSDFLSGKLNTYKSVIKSK